MIRAICLIVTVVVFAACGGAPAASQPTTAPSAVPEATVLGASIIDPAQCTRFGFSLRRCRAVARAAATNAGLDLAAIRAMELLPVPTAEPGKFLRGGGGWALMVRIHLKDGRDSLANVSGCGGIGGESSPLCTDNPVVYVMSPTINGYRDLPCADENGGGCATPLPAIDAKIAAGAVPLRVAAQDIPIDHAGRYEIALGSVTLANGILTSAQAALGDDHPNAFVVTEGVVWISLKSRDASRPPFENYYQHGWWPGTEKADVSVTFGIDEFEPGAVLQIRNLVVQ